MATNMKPLAKIPLFVTLFLSLLWGCTTHKPLRLPKKSALSSLGKSPSITQPPAVVTENIPTPSRSESLEEAALLQGELLLSQGMLLEAWQQWAPLAKSYGPGFDKTQADAAWRLMVASYFKNSDLDNTYRFLEEMVPTALTTHHIRILLQLARLQSKEQLHHLLEIQPGGSILVPFFQLALGDRLAQIEQESEAQSLWRDAQKFDVTAHEATRRLSNRSAVSPLRVGLLLPFGDRWARLGEHLLHAAQKALSDYRDVPIQLLIADSGDSEKTTRDAMNDLVARRVDVVVGPVFHESVRPAAEIATEHGIPLITMNPHRETSQPLSGVFSNAFHPKQQAEIMAQYAVLEKKYQRIVILAPESKYGRSMSETFSDTVLALGGAVVHTAYFPTNTLDFSTWLKPLEPSRRKGTLGLEAPLEPNTAQELIEAMSSLKPDFEAIFIPAPAKQIRLIAPQTAFFGVGIPDVALLGTALWNNPELLTEGTDYLNGSVFCDTSMEEKEWFRQAFNQSWKEEPNTLATLTYDGVAVLAQLLRDQRLGGEIWNHGLTQALAFQGASGPLRFLNNGQSLRNYHLFDIADGQIRFLQHVSEQLKYPSKQTRDQPEQARDQPEQARDQPEQAISTQPQT